jgi:hypothetical protein
MSICPSIRPIFDRVLHFLMLMRDDNAFEKGQDWVQRVGGTRQANVAAAIKSSHSLSPGPHHVVHRRLNHHRLSGHINHHTLTLGPAKESRDPSALACHMWALIAKPWPCHTVAGIVDRDTPSGSTRVTMLHSPPVDRQRFLFLQLVAQVVPSRANVQQNRRN